MEATSKILEKLLLLRKKKANTCSNPHYFTSYFLSNKENVLVLLVVVINPHFTIMIGIKGGKYNFSQPTIYFMGYHTTTKIASKCVYSTRSFLEV